MANRRNQAKKASKAARDAQFRAARASQIEAIGSKIQSEKPVSDQPPQKDHRPMDSKTFNQLKVLPAMEGGDPQVEKNTQIAAPDNIVKESAASSNAADKGKISLKEDMPKDLLKTTSTATAISIQVSASCIQNMIPAPVPDAPSAKAFKPDHPCTENTKTAQLPAPADKNGAKPPKRSFMRKLLVGVAAGAVLGVAAHVAASAATISAVAMAAPDCNTKTSFGMLGGIASKALDLAVLPISLARAVAA